MTCSICGGSTQPAFDGPQVHCTSCGTLHWVKGGEIHQSNIPDYWHNYEMDQEIFGMLRETLEDVGCCHGPETHAATPPMMFDSWIRCAVALREKRIRELEEVIKSNDLCHNMHGKVDATAFAEGCAQEQRKLYGCAPDADLAEKLLADNRRLRSRISQLEEELEESYGF